MYEPAGALSCVTRSFANLISFWLSWSVYFELRGHVLPVGGLKEKLLAAHRAGIAKVIIPEDNKKDLAEIPKNILDKIEIHTVKSVDEVLKIALTKELKPIEWIEVDKLPNTKGAEKTTTGSAH